MEKLRVVYSKSKEAIYMSHLDIMKVFEQSLSRANIQVEYSNGFNPRPELVFAHPLSVGIESVGEIVDINLSEKIAISFFVKELNQVLPNGIIILGAEYIDAKEKNIMSRVYAATYVIEFVYDENKFKDKTNREIEDIKKYYKGKLKEYFEQDNILTLKKSKDRMERIDIKGQIVSYNFLLDYNIEITINTGSKSNLKPSFVMSGFNEFIDENISYNFKRTKILYT